MNAPLSAYASPARAHPPLKTLAAALRIALLGLTMTAAALPHAVRAQEAAAPSAAGVLHFSLPAGPLATTLDRYARIAGVNVSYEAAQLAGVRSRGLEGDYTVEGALQALLADTGFEAVARGGGYAVRRGAARPSSAGGEVPVLDAVRVRAEAESLHPLPALQAGGQMARGGRLGMLGNADVMDAPFSVSSYSVGMIEDRQAVSVADVVGNDPSIRISGHPGDILDTFFIRGFPIGDQNSGEIAFDGVHGVAPNYRVRVDYAERIEVIKGPTALLYGMSPASSVGGTINIVPKRAGADDLTRFTASASPNAQYGGHLDLSRRFGPDRRLGIRFNGSVHDGDTGIDKQSRAATVGALALDYSGDRLRATLDIVDQREDIDAPSRRPFLGAGVAVPSAPDGRRNVSQRWERFETEDQSVLARVEYAASEQLTLFAGVGGGRTRVDRLFGNPTVLNAAGDTSTVPQRFRFDVDRSTAEAGLRARFGTGPVRHVVSAQVSTYRDRLGRISANGTAVLSNLYAPFDSPAQDVQLAGDVPRVSVTELSGFALSDTLSMYDERLQLTLGVRRQRVETDNFNPLNGALTTAYDESALTPLVGIVVKPWQRVALYANHIQGLSRGDIAPPSASNAGEVFAPYKARQNEVGVKAEIGGVIATLSAFQITKPSGQLTGTVFAVDGEQRNRGVELALSGEAAPGLRLLGGVTLLDADLTQTNSAATLGRTAVGVPSFMANLGAEWDATFLPGVTLTGNVMHTGSQYVDRANTLRVPDWTTVDLGARYRTTVAGRATVFRAQLRNAFDRNYWAGVSQYGSLVQGAPRMLLLSATVDF
ncbi:MAG: TonB-dependent receptor [Methyloversatilis discipulorum]|uniref:TonB-dependent receptor n=1 Tax=Methyloversatilis discipulorum TaxID=1119528 RepID=UPI0026E9E0D3|nr:TonB-dependent receptor [Methyloversatilis discipulorum]MBT9516599.1 TonB-dependent receptor [Methyloversatilis discipulorum]